MIPSVLPESLREELTKDLRGKTIRKLMTGHKTANGVIYLELSEESDGTQVLFALAGPWLDTLKTGKTLIIDELSNSLHPLVVELLWKHSIILIPTQVMRNCCSLGMNPMSWILERCIVMKSISLKKTKVMPPGLSRCPISNLEAMRCLSGATYTADMAEFRKSLALNPDA